MDSPDPQQSRAETVKALARAAGFDLVGVAHVEPSSRADVFRQWVADGKAGAMAYLANTVEDRVDLARKLPWAKSVVCVALAYFDPASEPARAAAPAGAGKVARYAVGRDYHAVFDNKLRALEKHLRAAFPGPMTCRTWSDAQVIHEREYAARAGLGWVGKHTLILHPRHGSYFLLGELVTSLDLAPDSPIPDHCGTCTRCIQACPTQAITPYSVDATKCISYHTLEHHDAIPEPLRGPTAEAGYVIGCDVCQEVCPFNRDPLAVTAPDLRPAGFTVQGGVVSLRVIREWDEQAWDIATRGKAGRRAKLDMWRRNAAVIEEAAGTSALEKTVR